MRKLEGSATIPYHLRAGKPIGRLTRLVSDRASGTLCSWNEWTTHPVSPQVFLTAPALSQAYRYMFDRSRVHVPHIIPSARVCETSETSSW